ncbi:MAG: aminoacyl-tRNA hydrolase [Desulfovibrio sp.]|jgi:PTH1 family peptidyl-tRNA hydrolase|nr:aminoacyl-tRNA hydrolase [Desulfovibrio sp.]
MSWQGALVGLGNPGPTYARTRHNCGYAVADALLEMAGRDGTVEELGGKRFTCDLWRVRMPALPGDWLVAKPLTFMNDSGRCIQPLLAWHKLEPANMVVVHDELDIMPGELRFKFAGGHAGHRGVKSTVELLGTPDFYRLRLGIGHPPHKGDVLNWVLGRPDAADAAALAEAVKDALAVFLKFATDGLEPAVNLARALSRERMAAAKDTAKEAAKAEQEKKEAPAGQGKKETSAGQTPKAESDA